MKSGSNNTKVFLAVHSASRHSACNYAVRYRSVWRRLPIDVLSATAYLFACASSAEAQGAPEVHNPAPDPRRPAFRISDAPMMVVGGLNEDARYELIGVTDAVMLASGRLAVALASSKVVRLYDSRGTFVRNMGRTGDGPGEFRTISALQARPFDTLWVYDAQLRRLTVLDSGG